MCISCGHRKRIFEPFFTTEGEKRTGLGLYVISGIASKHEGSIRVRSSTVNGKSGTCFRRSKDVNGLLAANLMNLAKPSGSRKRMRPSHRR
jgi:K+-sensing histidine kinase KdpD